MNVALKRLERCRTLAEGGKTIINLGLEDAHVPGESVSLLLVSFHFLALMKKEDMELGLDYTPEQYWGIHNSDEDNMLIISNINNCSFLHDGCFVCNQVPSWETLVLEMVSTFGIASRKALPVLTKSIYLYMIIDIL